TPLVYAIADIHGSLQKLRDLMTLCEQHADGRSATFVFLGDYIDRGPDSRGVVEVLMDLQSRRPDRVIALKGNHEAFAIEVVDGERDAEIWLREGGTANIAELPHRRRARPSTCACQLAALASALLRRRSAFFRSRRHRSGEAARRPKRPRSHLDQRAVSFGRARLRPPDRSWPHAANRRRPGFSRQPPESRYRRGVRTAFDCSRLCERAARSPRLSPGSLTAARIPLLFQGIKSASRGDLPRSF